MATINSLKSILESRWDNLAESIASSADSQEYRQHPDLWRSVKADAERFIAKAAPVSESEWQERRNDAAMLRKQWSVRLSDLRTANGRLKPVRRAG
jgi:hypothetical protein